MMTSFCRICGEELDARNRKVCADCDAVVCRDCIEYVREKPVCKRCRTELPEVEF